MRGDLSVVLNDLAYFGTILPVSEIERSKARCANISQSLSALSSLKDGRVVVSDHSSEKLLALVHSVIHDKESPLKLALHECYSADLTALLTCFETISFLVEQRLVTGANLEATANTEGRTLVISIHGDSTKLRRERYLSATEYASAELGETFVVQAVIVDLMLRAQGISISFEHESQLDVEAVRLSARLFIQQSPTVWADEKATI